jgi:hypothetical protein
MGNFSWITQDTGRCINNGFNKKKTFKVHMIDNKGNTWTEKNYEGYGVFEGKDFFVLLAEMNGKKTRDEGIDLYFGDEPFLSPNLNEYKEKWINRPPMDCPFQGDKVHKMFKNPWI